MEWMIDIDQCNILLYNLDYLYLIDISLQVCEFGMILV